MTPASSSAANATVVTRAPLFFRANLALAYARALSNRRVHEETLDVLKTFRPEQVVDPAAYLFHRSVAEHALVYKSAATQTITSGGSNESEQKELTVMPCGVPSEARVVNTATPVAKEPQARRNCWLNASALDKWLTPILS